MVIAIHKSSEDYGDGYVTGVASDYNTCPACGGRLVVRQDSYKMEWFVAYEDCKDCDYELDLTEFIENLPSKLQKDLKKGE